jgi:hypothetical protein
MFDHIPPLEDFLFILYEEISADALNVWCFMMELQENSSWHI